jgi:hypothetical protein
MRKILCNPIYLLQFFCIVTVCALLSCEKDEDENPPVIVEVRNYAASPDDTVLQTVSTGQWVVIAGKNLSGVREVYFGGVAAPFNLALSTSESLVMQIPFIPFQSVPRNKLNAITVVNNGGVASFDINITGAPIISYIRNDAAAPNDSIVDAIFPDQRINLVGYNLKGATKITFQGVEVDLSSVVYTDTSAVMQVPIDFSNADITLANTINYTTSLGSAAFHIGIVGPPLITNISNENPTEGSTVYISGYSFVSVESLIFAGTIISDFEVSADGGTIKFVAPELAESGPVILTTPGGKFTTIFNVNDASTAAVCNFDNISPVGWGGGGATVSDNNANFPGNKGKYAILQNGIVAPLDWKAWDGGRIIILDKVKWMPKENDKDSLDSWAVKFEINVPKAWNGNTLFVSSENNDYRIPYEPWKDATGKTFSFTTSGWKTITLPFSLFRKGWGGTEKPANLKDLLGDVESCGFAIQTMNISNANSVTGLQAAVDNIRIVKIK